jgi:hypothetical protein
VWIDALDEVAGAGRCRDAEESSHIANDSADVVCLNRMSGKHHASIAVKSREKSGKSSKAPEDSKSALRSGSCDNRRSLGEKDSHSMRMSSRSGGPPNKKIKAADGRAERAQARGVKQEILITKQQLKKQKAPPHDSSSLSSTVCTIPRDSRGHSRELSPAATPQHTTKLGAAGGGGDRQRKALDDDETGVKEENAGSGMPCAADASEPPHTSPPRSIAASRAGAPRPRKRSRADFGDDEYEYQLQLHLDALEHERKPPKPLPGGCVCVCVSD